MPTLTEVLDYHDELHAHPELAFAEQRTAHLVAAKLAEFGCEAYRGLAGTGVVGTIRYGNTSAAIGLRADMDALPIRELSDFSYRSTHDGLRPWRTHGDAARRRFDIVVDFAGTQGKSFTLFNDAPAPTPAEEKSTCRKSCSFG